MFSTHSTKTLNLFPLLSEAARVLAARQQHKRRCERKYGLLFQHRFRGSNGPGYIHSTIYTRMAMYLHGSHPRMLMDILCHKRRYLWPKNRFLSHNTGIYPRVLLCIYMLATTAPCASAVCTQMRNEINGCCLAHRKPIAQLARSVATLVQVYPSNTLHLTPYQPLCTIPCSPCIS